MRSSLARTALAILAGVAVSSCGDTPVSPLKRTQTPTPHVQPSSLVVMPPVRVSEFHYDNTGGDVGEMIEISGPAGTNLTGWSIVLYNGNTPTAAIPYGTINLTQTIPATCGARGVVVVPAVGLQNGGSDGFALVSPTGVVEVLSYEGTFTAASGAAAGLTSTDIGVSQNGTEPVGSSLFRGPAGLWGPTLPLGTNTFGACNDDGGVQPPVVDHVTISPASAITVVGGSVTFTAQAFDASNQVIPGESFTWTSSAPAIATVNASGVATGVATGDATITATSTNGKVASALLHVDPAPPPADLHINEIHYDNNSSDVGEAIEIEGPAGYNVGGWSLVLYNGNGGGTYATIALNGTIPATCGARGVLSFNAPGIQNGDPDAIALVNAGSQTVEFLSYGGVFTATNGPALGMTSTDIGVKESSSTQIGYSLQRGATAWYGPSPNSFGACNPPNPPVVNAITFSGRNSSDPALPVGFEDQIFATLRSNGVVVPTTFTWTSETPTIATVDANGVIHSLAAGTATFRATAADGTTATYSLPTTVATASTTAQYGHNTEFGEPADANVGDDFIIRRAQYTTSFNPTRGIPNWVSYNIDATHFGSQDRCDCFTFDPELEAAGFTRYTTNDYTGAGTAAGYGIDRGHLARSFDRTSGSLDNATTFYFSNIIPQASANNQGPWAAFESYLGDLARLSNKEVFVIAGASGSRGTVKNEGKITIPADVWKVALILPRDQGLADVDDYTDVQVIAAAMPNDPGVGSDWHAYETTVDAVEALSGYDVLALLPDYIEILVESNTHPPVAALDGPYAANEGSSIAMSGAASSDADGQPLTYAWNFGDGNTASGVSTAHTYTQDGSYTVTLIVTDALGIADTATTTANVANVAPVIAPFSGATLLPGETYTASGSFTDPGADSWTASVDYGDGASGALALSGQTFSLSHVYTTAGTYAVTVTVNDDDASGTASTTVRVLTQTEAARVLIGMVDELIEDGVLNSGNGNSLKAKLNAAIAQLARGGVTAASNQLNAFVNEVNALEQAGSLSAAQAAALRTEAARIVASL